MPRKKHEVPDSLIDPGFILEQELAVRNAPAYERIAVRTGTHRPALPALIATAISRASRSLRFSRFVHFRIQFNRNARRLCGQRLLGFASNQESANRYSHGLSMFGNRSARILSVEAVTSKTYP